MEQNSHHRGCSVRPALLAALCLFSLSARGQEDSAAINRQKLRIFTVASGVAYVSGVAALNYIWYKNTERQPFRFFNDNAEWKQMDKAGHFFSSFQLSALPAAALRGCGLPAHRANVYGAIAGFMLTLPIEVMDGFSDGYGASPGDVVADAAGPLFFLGQQLVWSETRIYPKLSFHRTRYAALNPSLLGESLAGEVVKDYNGQTFWLSVDMDRFAPFPGWLNLAVGYGAEEMVNARDWQNRGAGYDPYRQYYLALDLDLTAIRTRSRLIKALLAVVNAIHLPAPAIEFSRRGSKFHPFYF